MCICIIFDLQCIKHVFQFQRIVTLNGHNIPIDRDVLYPCDEQLARRIFIRQDITRLQISDFSTGVAKRVHKAGIILAEQLVFARCVVLVCQQSRFFVDNCKVRVRLTIQIDDTVFREVVDGCLIQIDHNLRMRHIRVGAAQRRMVSFVQQKCLDGVGFGDIAYNRHLCCAVVSAAGHFRCAAGYHFFLGAIRINSHHKVCCAVQHILYIRRASIHRHICNTICGAVSICTLSLNAIYQQLTKAVGCTYGHIGGVHLRLSGLLLLRLGIGCLQKRVGCNGSRRFLVQLGRGSLVGFFHCNNGCRIAVRSRKSSRRRNVQRHCQRQKHRKDSFHGS